MTRITQETLDLVKRWEGLQLSAYPDPGSKTGEPWTIGYGHTSDGFLKVRKGMKITLEGAEAALRHDLEQAAEVVARLVKVPLNDNHLGALVSFVFNLGAANFAGSTLLRKLNAGDYKAVPGELAKWVHNDGRVMPGLVNRRSAEARFWAREAPAAPQDVVLPPPEAEIKTAGGGFFAAVLAALLRLFGRT